MNTTSTDRRRLSQTVAVLASSVGLFCACGIGPRSSPPPAPPQITVSLSAYSIVFPATPLGSESPPQTLTITNAESSPLAFRVVLRKIVPPQFFLKDTTCTSPLLPGQSCTADVVYKPAAVGPSTGLLYLYSPGRPLLRVPLAGAGLSGSSKP